MDKVLVFEIKGKHGFFKRHSSSTSPTSYSSITKTALIGLISAIIGDFNGNDSKDNYLDYFNNNNCKISIEVLNPVKKKSFGLNYQNLKDIKPITLKHLSSIDEKVDDIDKELILLEDYHKNVGNYDRGNKYTQVNTEVLREPHYRIYFHHSDSTIYDLFKNRLENHETYYPTFMGTTDFPCEVFYQGEKQVSIIKMEEKENIKILSIVPESQAQVITEIKIEGQKPKRLQNSIKEKQPYLFIKEQDYRRNKEFIDLTIPMDAEPILCKVGNYCKVDGKNLLFY